MRALGLLCTNRRTKFEMPSFSDFKDLPRPSALANTLTLLIKASATVTVYRRHRRTLFFLPGIISS